MAVLTLAVSIFLVILIVISYRVQGRLTAPGPLFAIGWAIPYLILSTNIVTYDIEIVWTTHLYIILFVLSFLCGSWLATPHSNLSITIDKGMLFSESRCMWICLISLASIELVLNITDMLSAQGRGALALDTSTITSTKNLAWAAYFDGDIKSNAIRAVPVAAQQIIAIGTPYFFLHKRYALLSFGIVSIAMTLFSSILVGGRFNAVFVGLAIYLGIILISDSALTKLQKRIVKILKWSPLVVSVPLLLAIFFYFPILRNPFILENPDKFLIGAGYFSDWLNSVVTVMKMPELYILAISSTYFSYTVIACQISIEFGHVQDWYSLGLYNVGIISQVMGALGLGNPFHELRIQIAWFMDSLGLPKNPWATSARDFLIDFGYIGSVLIIFPIGYAITKLFYKLSNKLEAYITRSIILMMVSIFGILSPFPQRIVSSCLLLLLFLYLLDKVCRTLQWWPYRRESLVP